MSERSVAAPVGFICAACVHRLLVTGVPSKARGLQCAWCGNGADAERVLYEGLGRLEARGLGLATATLAGNSGQMAICGGCLAVAKDAIPE